ncbi:hypothetical protein Q5752_002523 [Cryptotrichosporon argae]
MSAYVPYHLVHAHLPAPPAVPHAIPEVEVTTNRPFPETTDVYSNPLHPDHASSISFDASSSVLARTLYNGHVLELRPLSPIITSSSSSSSTDVDTSAIRVFFPDTLRVLAGNSIVPSLRDGRLYVFAVSEANVVYRLNFALGRTGEGERHVFVIKDDDWCDEYEVPEDVVAAAGDVSSWSVIDEDTVVLGATDGGIIRVVRTGHWAGEGNWTAVHHRASSRLRIGSLFSRSAHEQVVSLADFQYEDQLAVLYTLSHDSKIRTWSSLTGQCLKTTDIRIPSTDLVRSTSTPPQHTDSSAALLRVLRHPRPGKYSHLVVAFVSTPHSATAGTFVVYRASNTVHGANDLVLAGERACSSSSAGAELRGFEVLPPSRADGADGWRLWAVWDKKGAIELESVRMDDIFQFTAYHAPPPPFLLEWQAAPADLSVDSLDAAYFDALLGPEAPDPTTPTENHDISDTFISHLFLPGRFSALTLSTALEEYIEQLPRRSRDAQATTASPTIAARFASAVGCQIEMTTSATTGAPVVEAYRKALKLDWLGIWARVRELDKQARWPLATAVVGGQLLVLAREGVVAPVPEEAAAVLVRLGQSGTGVDGVLALPEGPLKALYPALAPPLARRALIALTSAGSSIARSLDSIDSEDGSALETFVATVNEQLHTGLSEPIENLTGGWWDELVEPFLPEDDRTAVRRALSDAPSVLRALSDALDLLADTAPGPSSPVPSAAFAGLGNALLASTITATVSDRYTFARNVLLVALFHLSESADPSSEDEEALELIETLSRAVIIYHRYRVLYWLSEQTGIEAKERAPAKKGHVKDDVVADFGSLKMGDAAAEVDGFDASYALIHALLVRYPQAVTRDSASKLSTAAMAFLDDLALILPAQTELEPQASDVALAYKVLVDGHPRIAGQLAELYSPSAGMAYIKGRAGIETGLSEAGAALLEQAVAGCRDGSLRHLIPASPAEYYRQVLEFVARHDLDGAVVTFGQLAIACGDKQDPASQGLWSRVFLAQVALERYEDAYATLTSAPFLSAKRELLSHLISAMCEANAVGRLTSLGFVGLQKDVEERLNYKARNSDPLRFPNYYKVLYSWHIARGDYRSAAEIMYAQGRRFGEAHSAKISAFEIAAMQARSYLAAANALALVDKRSAWFAVHVSSGAAKTQKKRRASKYIPEDEFSPNNKAVDIVTLQDVQAAYTSVLSQLRLSSHIQDLHEHGVSLSPSELVGFFTQRGLFDLAQTSAASLDVDMTDLFTTLALRCVELARLPAGAAEHAAAAYLAVSPLTAKLRGPPAALALRYLQLSLQRHDGAKTGHRYRQAVADVWFEANSDRKAGWVMPVWLVEWEMARDPERWVARALQWGWIAEAVDWTADLVRRAMPPELLPANKADAAYIPYTLIDRVLAATQDSDEKDEPAVQAKASQLRAEVERRVAALKKL